MEGIYTLSGLIYGKVQLPELPVLISMRLRVERAVNDAITLL